MSTYRAIWYGDGRTIVGPTGASMAECVRWAGQMPRTMGPNGPVEYTAVYDSSTGREVVMWTVALAAEGCVPVWRHDRGVDRMVEILVGLEVAS